MAETTFAVLGATGKTGRGVVQELLDKTDSNIHLYVRSLEKLSAIFPGINSNPRISIFEGSIRDAKLMTKCLTGVDTIMFTLGDNDNRPTIDVIETGAKTILSALQTLSEHTGVYDWKPLRVIMLSSSTWNPRFAAARPPAIHWAIKTAFSHPYADLRRGMALLMNAPTLCSTLLVQPGGLIEDAPSGFDLSTKSIRLVTTYADLAAGFVELATASEYATLDAVGISSGDGDNYPKYAPTLGYWIVKGLCAQFVPGFWPVHDAFWACVGWLTGRK